MIYMNLGYGIESKMVAGYMIYMNLEYGIESKMVAGYMIYINLGNGRKQDSGWVYDIYKSRKWEKARWPLDLLRRRL